MKIDGTLLLHSWILLMFLMFCFELNNDLWFKQAKSPGRFYKRSGWHLTLYSSFLILRFSFHQNFLKWKGPKKRVLLQRAVYIVGLHVSYTMICLGVSMAFTFETFCLLYHSFMWTIYIWPFVLYIRENFLSTLSTFNLSFLMCKEKYFFHYWFEMSV
jgi:hypothetical protein